MKPVLRGTDERRSSLRGGSSLSLLIGPSLHTHTSSAVSLSLHHNLSLSMDIHDSTDWTSHQQRLRKVRGAQKGLGDEYKRSQAFVSVSEVLICSRQVTAQWHKCQVLPSVVMAIAASCILLLISFSPQVKITHQCVLAGKKNSLGSSVCLAVCFAQAHCITWCSSASASFFSFAFCGNFSTAAVVSGWTTHTCQEGLLLLHF